MAKSTRLVKKPNAFLWYTLGPIAKLWYKTRVKFTSEKIKAEGKTLFLASHRNYYDIMVAFCALFPKRVHFVSTSYWYRNKTLGSLLRTLGCIKKDQYKSDIQAIKGMAECFSNNESIILFPEAQISVDGRPQLLVPGLDKLILKYKPSVYILHSHGAFASKPKWAKKASRGPVDVWFTKLFSPADLDAFNPNDIMPKIEEELSLDNDLKWLSENPDIKYINKNKAWGLEKVLVYCPKCHSELTLKTDHSRLYCDCGFSVNLKKENYELLPNEYGLNNLDDIFSFEYEMLKNDYENDIVLEDSCKIVAYLGEVPVEETSYNKVKMTKDSITFISPDKEESFELSKLISFVITLDLSFEVPTNTYTYRVYPENGRRSIHYWYLMRYIKEKLARESKN